MRLETERLVIDRLRPTDKEDYFLNISHDKKVLETFVCRYADTLEEFDFSPLLENRDLYAIRQKPTERLIGILTCFDEKDGACEIGYGIGAGFWNRGYATEAVRRFLDHCFDARGLDAVYASFFNGNDASRRVMEKCGMALSHVTEKEFTYLGVERDLTYYVLRKQPELLLLNGPSSAGKSSIASELQARLRGAGIDAVTVALDDYLPMSAQERIWEDDVYAVNTALCRDAAQALGQGRSVVVDHVLTSARIYEALSAAAAGYRMKKILVRCDPEELRRREAARGNRWVGSAEASLQYLYPQRGYDLCVDSTKTEPSALAETIMERRAAGWGR